MKRSMWLRDLFLIMCAYSVRDSGIAFLTHDFVKGAFYFAIAIGFCWLMDRAEPETL